MSILTQTQRHNNVSFETQPILSATHNHSRRRNYYILLLPLGIFCICASLIYISSNILAHKVIFHNGKTLYDYGLPGDLDEVRELSGLLNAYFTTDNYSIQFQLLLLYILIFITKQTFSIPGSGILNILSGCSIPLYLSFPLVTVLTTVGATCCFLMSAVLGDTLALTLFSGERIDKIQTAIHTAKKNNNLFYYILSLRLLPMAPQSLLNIASPIAGVPIHIFAATCFLGLMPYCYITTSAGSIIAKLALNGSNDTMTFSDIFDTSTIIKLVSLAILSLSPTVYRWYTERNTLTKTETTLLNTIAIRSPLVTARNLSNHFDDSKEH